jgi:hypothetical protein
MRRQRDAPARSHCCSPQDDDDRRRGGRKASQGGRTLQGTPEDTERNEGIARILSLWPVAKRYPEVTGAAALRLQR